MAWPVVHSQTHHTVHVGESNVIRQERGDRALWRTSDDCEWWSWMLNIPFVCHLHVWPRYQIEARVGVRSHVQRSRRDDRWDYQEERRSTCSRGWKRLGGRIKHADLRLPPSSDWHSLLSLRIDVREATASGVVWSRGWPWCACLGAGAWSCCDFRGPRGTCSCVGGTVWVTAKERILLSRPLLSLGCLRKGVQLDQKVASLPICLLRTLHGGWSAPSEVHSCLREWTLQPSANPCTSDEVLSCVTLLPLLTISRSSSPPFWPSSSPHATVSVSR